MSSKSSFEVVHPKGKSFVMHKEGGSIVCTEKYVYKIIMYINIIYIMPHVCNTQCPVSLGSHLVKKVMWLHEAIL